MSKLYQRSRYCNFLPSMSLMIPNMSKEAIWLRTLLQQHSYSAPDVLYGDNQPVWPFLALMTTPEYHSCTKHIAISWYYILCEQGKGGLIKMEYLCKIDTPADRLTKPILHNYWDYTRWNPSQDSFKLSCLHPLQITKLGRCQIL